jgi:cobalamin biosynthesis protein CbiG
VVIGVGVASAATVEEVAALVATSLAEAGMTCDDVTAVATIESRRDHPAIAALGLPVVAFPPEELAKPDEPGGQGPRNPAGGRPAVAEPAALRVAALAGTAVLLVAKRRSARATVAVAAATAAAGGADERRDAHGCRRDADGCRGAEG